MENVSVCIIANGFPSEHAFAYDAQTKAILNILRDAGVRQLHVVNIAWTSRDETPRFDQQAGAWLHPSPIPHYPAPLNPEDFKGPWNLIITIIDVVVFQNGKWPCKAFAWFPAHYASPTVRELDALKAFHLVVPMTQHAKKCLLNASLNNVADAVVHNVVDPHNDFRNLPPPTHQGPFTFLCIAMNYETSQRKGHAALLAAFRMLLDRGVDARLIMHAPKNDNGIDLKEVADALRLQPPQLILSENMVASTADVMKFAHVVVVPSKAEGFGIPIVEAQIAGRPVIANDFGAMAEMTRVGIRVPPASIEWNACQAGFWAVPDVRAFAIAMEAIKNDFDKFAKDAGIARNDIAACTSRDAVARNWTSVIDTHFFV